MVHKVASTLFLSIEGLSQNRLCVRFTSPGAFNKVGESGRIHFHLFWYFSGCMVPSSGETHSENVEHIQKQRAGGSRKHKPKDVANLVVHAYGLSLATRLAPVCCLWSLD